MLRKLTVLEGTLVTNSQAPARAREREKRKAAPGLAARWQEFGLFNVDSVRSKTNTSVFLNTVIPFTSECLRLASDNDACLAPL